MSKQIWKWELPDPGIFQNIELPRGAEVCHVDIDPLHKPCLWAIVETEAPLETANVWVLGTGMDLSQDGAFAEGKHIGSYIQAAYVWHVFLRQPLVVDSSRSS